MNLTLTPIINIPFIQPGDDVPHILYESVVAQGIHIKSGDIVSVTQKIVSKAENRFVSLSQFVPSEKAKELAKITKKDPRLIELILSESKEIIRAKPNTIIVEHRLGFICASAGVDRSNVSPSSQEDKEKYLLLPKHPEKSAEKIRDHFFDKTRMEIGVIIIDSHGRPWRYGVVGITIGTVGVPALVDLRGYEDIFNRKLKITQVAAADELAAASSLIMGQANEKIPAVHIRGFPYDLRESSISELIREKEKDLFR
jgi:coenzyme F420-0:L-glutamate ligase/coenzyme F420-1:gamma-L-glutamate ligase